VAVTALQVNLKTFDYERIALNVGYGVTYKTSTVNLGAAIYAGVGLSSNEPNAPQASLLFNVGELVAFGPGEQMFSDSVTGERIFQGLFSVSLNYNVGGSSTYVADSVKAERMKSLEIKPCQ
jgi:hypothetical protein